MEKTLSSSNKVTFGILYFLLLLRLTDFYIKIIAGDYAPTFAYYYILITIILITTVIWLNKEHLNSLHIDKYFVYIFMALGLLVFIYFGISWLGVVGCLSALCIILLLRKRKLLFENDKSLMYILLLSVLGVAPVLLLRLFSSEPTLFIKNFFVLDGIGFLGLIFKVLWSVVYEEMLFRGMLWMFLERIKLSSIKILLIQSFLFWIAHLHSVSKISFWVFLPIMSLWLGFLVLKSKSLLPSTITHFLDNLISYLI